MPKALSRLHSLEKSEQKMQTVLALIMAIFARKAGENRERTVYLLEEQKNDLTEVLSRFDETSTVIDNAICHVEKQFGPVANVALYDKVDNHLR
jgi:hypothetical protein